MDRCALILVVVAAALAGLLTFDVAATRGASLFAAGGMGCIVTGALYVVIGLICPVSDRV